MHRLVHIRASSPDGQQNQMFSGWQFCMIRLESMESKMTECVGGIKSGSQDVLVDQVDAFPTGHISHN